MSNNLMTRIANDIDIRWSPEPVEPSLKRGIFSGILLSLPLWGLILKILF
jgi:hypothetical protein